METNEINFFPDKIALQTPIKNTGFLCYQYDALSVVN